MIHTLETLPVELVAEILSELDLSTLITVSCLSRRLRTILSDVRHLCCYYHMQISTVESGFS